jgi:hypothetical protein
VIIGREKLIYINPAVDIVLFNLEKFLSIPSLNFLLVEECKRDMKELILIILIINSILFCWVKRR